MEWLRSRLARLFGGAAETAAVSSGPAREAAASTDSASSGLGNEAPDLVVLGLGNPGPDYADTRHNIGFRVVEALAHRWGLDWQGDVACEAEIALGTRASSRVLLAKPQTFMNASGRTVEALREVWPALRGDRLLVVFDDMDLPTGRIRLRPSGGSGGHRGLGDILAVLDDRGVPRLRFGVGHPGEAGQAVLDHVLAPFAEAEQAEVAAAIARAADAVEAVLAEGLPRAMGQFNAKS